MNQQISRIAVLASLVALSAPALAGGKPADKLDKGDLTNTACSFTAIISNVGLSGTCAGFYSGNLLNTEGNQLVDADEIAGLAALGVSSPGSVKPLQKIDDLDNLPANFSPMLYGDTVVAFHFGQSAFPDSYNGSGGGTAFLRFDAGSAGIDVLTFKTTFLNANSGATLYLTGTAPVPEPETYAMMLAGLAAMGFIARRRQQA